MVPHWLNKIKLSGMVRCTMLCLCGL